jgi:hypothetical protein
MMALEDHVMGWLATWSARDLNDVGEEHRVNRIHQCWMARRVTRKFTAGGIWPKRRRALMWGRPRRLVAPLGPLTDSIEEYARQEGHAGLIREAVDGLVGEDPPE